MRQGFEDTLRGYNEAAKDQLAGDEPKVKLEKIDAEAAAKFHVSEKVQRYIYNLQKDKAQEMATLKDALREINSYKATPKKA